MAMEVINFKAFKDETNSGEYERLNGNNGEIRLGGGICAAGDVFLTPLKRKVNRGIFGGTKFAPVEIVVASLGNDAGIYGAAALAMN